MSTPLSLDDLRRMQPPHVDVDLKGLGTLRIARLNVNEKLEVLDLVSQIERDESGKAINVQQNVETFVTIACKSLRGPEGSKDFDNDEGRGFISRLNDFHFKQVVNAVLKQVGFDNEIEDESDEESDLVQSKND